MPPGEHGVHRLPQGGVRVTIGTFEHRALRSLPDQLRAVVDGEIADSRLRDRLFPVASQEPEIDAEYRQLIGSSLVDDRIDLIDRFTKGLDGGAEHEQVWTNELDADDTHAWIVIINDLRQILSGVVGITSETEWERGPAADDPASLLLWGLGWLQEQLIAAIEVPPAPGGALQD